MKIRHGFVSNSSSSSFIVVIPENISRGQLRELLFNGEDSYCSPYGDGGWSTADVTDIVHRDISAQYGGKTIDEAAEEYGTGWTDAYKQAEREVCDKYNIEDTWQLETDESCKAWDEIDKRRKELSKEKIKLFWNEYVVSGVKVYIVEYSDNDGPLFCAMENGPLFDNVPHLKVSHH